VVEPVLQREWLYLLYNLSQDEYKLGGSSFAQTLNTIGKDAPTIKDAASSKSVQYHSGINLEDNILAGHDEVVV
jgi:phosphoribosylformylglycinamidine synthase